MPREKVKFALRISPETQQLVKEMCPRDNCQTQNEFIERAIRFYAGYISGREATAYLPPALASVLRGTVQDTENRICRLLFKLAVELDSKAVSGNEIIINKAAVADLEAEAAQTAAAVDTALVNGGVATARYISNTVTLTTDSTSEISIRIDPDILTTGVDKIRVEGPSYALTFNVSELEEDLTEILTFKAEPVNTSDAMLAGGNPARPLAVSLRGYSPFSSGQVYVADNTASCPAPTVYTSAEIRPPPSTALSAGPVSVRRTETSPSETDP